MGLFFKPTKIFPVRSKFYFERRDLLKESELNVFSRKSSEPDRKDGDVSTLGNNTVTLLTFCSINLFSLYG